MSSAKFLELIEKSIIYWTDVKESSAPGTLAYSEAEYFLERFNEAKENPEIINFENLSQEELNEISGGNKNVVRGLASLMALATIGTSGTSANAAKKDSSPAKSDVVTIKKSTLKKAGIIAGAVTGAVGIAAAGAVAGRAIFYKLAYPKLYKSWTLKDVTTAVDSLSDEQVKQAITQQIAIYKNRDPEVFEFDDKLLTEAHPRTLLITLIKMNQLFEKYDKFTKEFIEYKKSQESSEDRKFIVKLKDSGHNSSTLASTNIYGFYLGRGFISEFKDALFMKKQNTDYQLHSYVSNDQLIDGIITHEFGHLIERLFISKYRYKQIVAREEATKNIGLPMDITSELGVRQALNQNMETVKSLYDYINSDISKDLDEDHIKKHILEIAKEKYNNKNEVISEYGKKDSEEFFAEAFAHLECNKESDINPIGLATRDYIKNWFE